MGAPDHCADVNVYSYRGAAAAERISAKMGTSEHYMGVNVCGNTSVHVGYCCCKSSVRLWAPSCSWKVYMGPCYSMQV